MLILMKKYQNYKSNIMMDTEMQVYGKITVLQEAVVHKAGNVLHLRVWHINIFMEQIGIHVE